MFPLFIKGVETVIHHPHPTVHIMQILLSHWHRITWAHYLQELELVLLPWQQLRQCKLQHR